ncbi:MAG: V-type ATP synthase subunit E family protein [Candidatus Micrarchaeota archaeon]
MSLDALKEELARKTRQEVQRLEAEGKKEAKGLRDEAAKEAERKIVSAKKEALDYVERDRMRIAAARLKAKHIVLDSRYGAVSEAKRQLGKLLEKKASGRREYEKMLGDMIQEALFQIGSEDAVIYVRRDDLALAKKYGTAKPIQCKGGAIIASQDGRIRIDSTFEALLEKNKEKLEQAAFDEMFGRK